MLVLVCLVSTKGRTYLNRSSHRRCSIKKSCSKKFRNIHRKTPVLESLFNKVAELKACKFIKKKLQRRCFPVNIAKFLRAPILKNTWEWLFLLEQSCSGKQHSKHEITHEQLQSKTKSKTKNDGAQIKLICVHLLNI